MGSELLSCVQLFVSLWAAAHQAPLCPWNFPIRNTVVGCHFLLQGIFLTQGSNLCLSVLYWQVDSLPLSYLGSPMSRMAENHMNFKPAFSLFFTLIKRLFSVSFLSAIRELLSAYLRLLIFLLAVLLPACASASPAFRMMYSAYV